MSIYEVRIRVPGNEPDTRPIHENFYVIAPTREDAINAVRIREGVQEVWILRELDENEARAFRYLRSAEF